jgi:hypothetical protein
MTNFFTATGNGGTSQIKADLHLVRHPMLGHPLRCLDERKGHVPIACANPHITNNDIMKFKSVIPIDDKFLRF